MTRGMPAERFVLVQGLRDTRGTLLRWNADPWGVLRGWFTGAAAITAGLLLAIAFVVAATAFSLLTQAYALGHAASSLAEQGGVSPVLLLAGILPHAVPELVALFLPLAAWIIASRHDDWHELLAATFVTVAIAVPMLVAAAFVEVYASPHVIVALRG